MKKLKKLLKGIPVALFMASLVFASCGGDGGGGTGPGTDPGTGPGTGPGTDTRVALTAGSPVNVSASAETVNVTFTGAGSLTSGDLAASDFTASNGATIETVSVASGTVTVTVNFAANTSLTETKTYTVGINAASTKIKGSGTVAITQGVKAPDNSAQIIYYFVNEGDQLTVTAGKIQIAIEEELTITAGAEGYTVKQWHINGVNTGHSGETYTFSSTVAGTYTIGLFVEKSNKPYNANITITVAN